MITPVRTIMNVSQLALVIWREARGEPRLGKLAVAYSILNRVARPTWWGHDIPTVIWKKWQYSSMTADGDPQLALLPTPYKPEGWDAYEECLEVAFRAYFREEANPAPGADSYYAWTIKPPKWADPQLFVAEIGGHRFYNLDRDVEAEQFPQLKQAAA